MNVVACPSCSKQLQYNPQQAGMQVKCPACQTAMILPGAPGPTQPADPLMGGPMQTPPTDPLMGAPMQTPQMPAQQPGMYEAQPSPAYSQRQPPQKKSAKSSSKKKIILWSSIGGGVLAVVIVLILVFSLGGSGQPFPVPDYFTEISLEEYAESPEFQAGLKLTIEVENSDNWFYESEGKSEDEVYSYFEEKLPSYGWKKELGLGNVAQSYSKKSNEYKTLTIMIDSKEDSQKLKVRISRADLPRL